MLIFAYTYLALLALLLLLRLLFQDRWWWLSLLNSLVFYAFLPLPALILIAVVTRHPEVWLGFWVMLGVFLWQFGSLFWPAPPERTARGPRLTVMTYNALDENQATRAVLDLLRACPADVIGLQEINPEVEAGIRLELCRQYPYQVFAPQHNRFSASRNAILSRLPLDLLPVSLPGEWSGQPLLCRVDFETGVLMINAHGFPTRIGTVQAAEVDRAGRVRADQAYALADFAARSSLPLILTADLNSTDQNQAYRILARQLQDAWRRAGWGLGHTFGLREKTFGGRVLSAARWFPRWLLRIDYIFYSRHWDAVTARLGANDGGSDHRPVIAVLELRQP